MTAHMKVPMTIFCRLNIHTRSRYFIINPAGRYALTCKRCGKETK